MDDLQSGKSVSLSKLLAGEIALSTVINIAFNFFFAWLAFYGAAPIGRDGVMLDVLPATIVPALVMTFPITFLMHARMKKGLTLTSDARSPFALPRLLPLRAAAVAVLALGLVAVPVVLLLWAFWADDWSWNQLLLFKLAFSLFHAAVVTPIVVLAALGRGTDGPLSGMGEPA